MCPDPKAALHVWSSSHELWTNQTIPLFSDIYLLSLRSLYHHSGTIHGTLSDVKIKLPKIHGAVQGWYMQGDMHANTHTHTLTTQLVTHLVTQKSRQTSFRRWPVQHVPGQDQIYKQWLDTGYIFPGDIRFLLTMEGLWKRVKEREQFTATHQTFSFLKGFLGRMVIGKGPGTCSREPLVVFLYVEDLLQQLTKECKAFSGISRKCLFIDPFLFSAV